MCVPSVLSTFCSYPNPFPPHTRFLVDPHKESGQSLYRQYVGKKGKLVLNAQWVIRSVEAGALQTYHTNFGGCKVTGMEE